MTEKIDVVVIGGGYAGVIAANRLTQRDDVAVTLINPRPRFVERIRLHQVVAGTHEAVVDYREILADRVKLVVDTAARIDAGARRVTLEAGGTLGYDYLVYAVGSVGVAPSVPGAAEFAYPAAALDDAQRLRKVIAAAPPTAQVTVVGGGSTGIEVAAELADAGRPVSLVCGGVLSPYLHPRARRVLAKRLTKLGVDVIDGAGSTVTAVAPDLVRLRDGRELPSQVTIWAAGFSVPDLATRSGLRADPLGRLLTDETLTSVDDERIVAAGDSAAPSGLPLRMSVQAARPLGAHAADTVLARLAGKPPARLNVGLFGQCIALGSGGALLQFAAGDDTANRFHYSGSLAAKIKERALRLVIAELATEARKPGSFRWKYKDDSRQQRLLARADHQSAIK